MANRQRGSRPDRRTGSVNRSPTAGRSSSVRVRTTPGVPMIYTEPEIRRWPHLAEEDPELEAVSEAAPEPALHYIRCALSYQNQLLSDIKALLERMAAAAEGSQEKG